MRYRNREQLIYTPGGTGDLFAEHKTAFFIRYTGGLSAKIYVKNKGFKTVPLTEIQHRQAVSV